MGNMVFGERHIVNALPPVADAFTATVYSDVLKVKDYALAEFIIQRGVGATGTSTITVEACDDAAGNNPVAIPFAYQDYDNADDVPDDVVQVAATGFTTAAGSNFLFSVQAEMAKMPETKKWIRLKAVEVVDSPVLAGILAILHKPRYAAHVPETVIA